MSREPTKYDTYKALLARDVKYFAERLDVLNRDKTNASDLKSKKEAVYRLDEIARWIMFRSVYDNNLIKEIKRIKFGGNRYD